MESPGAAYAIILDEASTSIYSLGTVFGGASDDTFVHARLDSGTGDLTWADFLSQAWSG